MKNKYLNYFLASALLCVGTTKFATAQWSEGTCGISNASNALELAHPELVQQRIDYDNSLTHSIKSARAESDTSTYVYIIPIVFHILHVNGVENISDAQIIAQVNKMNQDWAKQNSDTTAIVPAFIPLASNVHIQFRLAQIDPNGNCTNGIDRIYTHKTFFADESSKLNQWPRDKYLNLWVVASIKDAGVAGYALYPSDVATFGYPEDGVVLLASVCNGSSRVLSHEIAHCFSLQHTFGNTNSAGVTCADDLVDDTPITKGHPGTCDMTPACTLAAFASPYNFSSVTTSSGTIDTATVASNLYCKFSKCTAVGVSANSSVAGQFSFTNWDLGGLPLDSTSSFDANSSYPLMTGAVNTAKYYQIKVDTVKGTSLTITSLNFAFQRNATGVRSFSVRSSIDGYTANIAASTGGDTLLKIKGTNEFFVRYDTTSSLTGCTISLGAAFKNQEKPITFRIYGWNAEDAAGSFGIDNVNFVGSGGVVENVQNYMEYATCPVMFTMGQRARMKACLNSPIAQRNNLWLNSNLIATGTTGTAMPACTPRPDFYANHYTVCPGGSVLFTKDIMDGTETSRTWTFPGGTPSTFTGSTSPNVTYSTPGSYDVTLTATNASGTGTITKTNNITVSQPYAMVSPGLSTDDFENLPMYYLRWYSEDLDANSRTWWLTTAASYNGGTRSVYMNAYYDYANDVDNLYSPSYNIAYVGGATLTFRCAAATRATVSADLTDHLKVYASKDCGASWFLMKNLTGATGSSALINNGYHPEEFIPTSPSQWALISATINSTYVTANTRFKFEYTAGAAGNDIYIDDVNISGVQGVDNSTLDENNVALYPNPANQSSTLAYHLNAKANTKIELIDVLGKKIMEVNNANQTEGDYTIQISKQDLGLYNGIYFVKVSVDNNTITKKLIITE